MYSETSTDVVFEYKGDGCCVPRDITSVRFIEGLQKIGFEAFRKCTSLESITFPSTLELRLVIMHLMVAAI